MTQEHEPRLYAELSTWWPLFSPPSEYEEEAADLLPTLLTMTASPATTLLELGSGGGSLASHFKRRFTLTLSDRSKGMLEVSREVNPEAEHVLGDMRTLDLGRQFDRVLVHDAIMYALDADALRATLATAHRHCRPGGGVLIVPDCVKETFEPEVSSGGHDGADGRGLRYIEWASDSDPNDDTFEVAYAFVLRDPNGVLSVDGDRHRNGIFRRAAWFAWIRELGFDVSSRVDVWGREVFSAVKEMR